MDFRWLVGLRLNFTAQFSTRTKFQQAMTNTWWDMAAKLCSTLEAQVLQKKTAK